MLYRRIAIVILMAGLVGACGKGLPADKGAYAGTWSAPGIYLRISPSGRVKYRRSVGGPQRKIAAPIKHFEGNDFIVGVAFISTRFKVQRPPFRAGGRMHMVVDGRRLTRLAGGARADEDDEAD